MTLIRLTYACICSLCLALPCASLAKTTDSANALPALSAATSDARPAIQAAYDGLNAAFTSRDLDRFMSYFTPDYTEADANGTKTDKAGARKHYQDQLNRIKTMTNHYVIQSITPVAGGDQVEMTMHSDGTGEKHIFFARFKGTFTNDLVVRDLWVETPQGWRLKYRQTIHNETHIHPG